jgi:dihydrofolate synthase / folylpolyglutamate synthase
MTARPFHPETDHPERSGLTPAGRGLLPAAMAYLNGLTGYEQTGWMEHPTIERMARLIGALGNPQRAYPVIHLTGTNGKGSTAAMTAGLLSGQGLRVGAYTSPHITRLAERITVGGQPVADRDLARAVGQVREAAMRAGVTPSWFEAVTAVGFSLLAEARVDVAVVEVGMLGRWDATNVADGAVAVVTNVQLDHTDVAGPTREAIAAEKAGIIKPGATLILGERDPALRAIFEARRPARILAAGREMSWRNRRATPAGSVVDLVNPWGVRAGIGVGMMGAHQCDNALLALTAAEAFTGATIPVAAVTAALGAAHVPGRFEIVLTSPVVALDGAHNPAGAAALRRTVEESFAAVTPRILLYGALAGRDPVEFLDQVGVRSADLVITTEPPSPRALPADVLARAVRGFAVPVIPVRQPEQALSAAVTAAGRHGLVTATGSLYLMAPLRAAALARPARVLP